MSQKNYSMKRGETTTGLFLSELHKGGKWAFYWTDQGNRSEWWKAGSPAEIPNGPNNWYFGVHPTDHKGGIYERSKIENVTAINCLFADFDAKDFEGGKGAALTHICGLDIMPSVLVDSGGGYHAYWLLRETFTLDTPGKQKRAGELQAAWVVFVGGDQGAKDLARVLRLPGTQNHKPAYPKPLPVGFVSQWVDLDLKHDLNDLERLSRPEPKKTTKKTTSQAPTIERGDYWLSQARLRASVGTRNETGLWLSCQLRDGGLTQGEADPILRAYAASVPGDGYKESEALASLKQAYTRPSREAAKGKGQSSPPPAAVDVTTAPRDPQEALQDLEPATWADIRGVLGPITWAWDGWLPDGMLTIVASEPGKGKSALCLRIAESFLTGKDWPDGTKYTGKTGKVLWCEGEAAQAINLDRAEKWGLPIDKLLTPSNDPLEDVKLDNGITQAGVRFLAERDDIRLVIIDSLRSVISGDENNSETITFVMWLAALARDTGKPILLTHHLRKRGLFDGDEKPSLDRLRGSTAIVQAARLVWALDEPDPYQPEVRRISAIKSNLAAFPESIGMWINEKGVFFREAPEVPRTESVGDRAADLLLSLLDKTPMKAKDLEAEFDLAGISWVSAKRAKGRLGIISIKNADGWFWSLPAMTDTALL